MTEERAPYVVQSQEETCLPPCECGAAVRRYCEPYYDEVEGAHGPIRVQTNPENLEYECGTTVSTGFDKPRRRESPDCLRRQLAIKDKALELALRGRPCVRGDCPLDACPVMEAYDGNQHDALCVEALAAHFTEQARKETP